MAGYSVFAGSGSSGGSSRRRVDVVVVAVVLSPVGQQGDPGAEAKGFTEASRSLGGLCKSSLLVDASEHERGTQKTHIIHSGYV